MNYATVGPLCALGRWAAVVHAGLLLGAVTRSDRTAIPADTVSTPANAMVRLIAWQTEDGPLSLDAFGALAGGLKVVVVRLFED